MMGRPSPAPGGTEVYADMDHWAEIRRRVLTGEISKRQACREYDLHWLTLKKILSHEEPPGYRRRWAPPAAPTPPRPAVPRGERPASRGRRPPRRPTIDPVLPVIRRILDGDATAPKKQRHTAHRIW